MKKLLLSSIIMLGVCGIASAQTDSKASHKHPQTTSAAAVTPQKAAFMPASDAAASTTDVSANGVAADKEAASATPAPSSKAARVAKSQATAVNTAGVAVPSDDAKRREEKMAAAKAANAAPTGRPAKQRN